MAKRKNVELTAPKLNADHIYERISCIRAHRERLFFVGTEKYNDKLIIHNYGHGGAGWTFLFGCVNESLRLFESALANDSSLRNKPITIIGAGCYGLLTAIELARRDCNVKIIAKERHDLASEKAAGFFFPRHRKSSTAEEKAVFLARGLESYQTYLTIVNGKHPFIQSGPKLLPAYYGLDIDPGFTPYIDRELIATPDVVTLDFGNGKQYEAMEYQTIFVNPAIIMRELRAVVQNMGIALEQKEIECWDDINDSIIFNCAGFGAKALTHDKKIVPIQGHLVSLKNQPIEDMHYMLNFKVIQSAPKGGVRDELIYFAPKDNGILGITFIRGQDDPHANAHEFERLLERCQQFFGE